MFQTSNQQKMYSTTENDHQQKTGWWFQPLRKSVGMIIRNIWKNKKMVQTTDQKMIIKK